jgi:hypothetical protein
VMEESWRGEGQASDPILTSLRRRVWWIEEKEM